MSCLDLHQVHEIPEKSMFIYALTTKPLNAIATQFEEFLNISRADSNSQPD